METNIFFFISYSTEIKESPDDIIFLELQNDYQKPQCIYLIENYENNKYFYIKIFKLIFRETEENNVHLEYEVNDDKYIRKLEIQ